MINNATTITQPNRKVITAAEFVKVGDHLRFFGTIDEIIRRGDEVHFNTPSGFISFVSDEDVTVFRA